MEVVNVGGMSRRQHTLDRIGNRVRWWVGGHWLGVAELTAYRAGVPIETIYQARNYYPLQETVGMDRPLSR